jgi:hypothetical protein
MLKGVFMKVLFLRFGYILAKIVEGTGYDFI